MHSDLLDRDSATSLAEAITALEGVAGLDSGQFGEVAILFPGARVRGIHVTTPRTGDDGPRLEVNIIAELASLPDLGRLADDVRDVASRFVDIPVDVTVADVA